MAPPLTLEVLRAQSDLSLYLWDYYLEYAREADAAHQLATGNGLGDAGRRALGRTLPLGIQYVMRVTDLDGDILNGGIAQFFYNHTPREVVETVDALRAIGLNETLVVLEEAIAVYERKFDWPRDSDERWLEDPSWDDPELKQLDDCRCNELASARDFDRLNAHLREHLDQCVL